MGYYHFRGEQRGLDWPRVETKLRRIVLSELEHLSRMVEDRLGAQVTIYFVRGRISTSTAWHGAQRITQRFWD